MDITVAEVLRYYGVLNVRDGGSEISFSCPFHEHDQHPSASMNAKTGKWICHKCGERGNSIWKFISRCEGISEDEAMEMWAHGFAVEVPDLVRDRDGDPLPLSLLSQDRAPRYMYKRGFDDRTLSAFRVAKKIRNDHVYAEIPAFTRNGELVGMIYRAANRTMWPRYLYTTGFPRKEILFGMLEAGSEFGNDYVILCEGSLDAMRLFQLGFPAVSALGSMLSFMQAELITEFGHIYLCGDADAAGKFFNLQAAKVLTAMVPFRTSMLVLPDGVGDPGELVNRDTVRRMIDASEITEVEHMNDILREGRFL